ncbi:sugar O-acetyltransferase [Gallicola sp. Sow4_E12]|uniref:sugar O-acetyltransferase n=1 Tax=Gallicola sp. Sow4_E12 TaxID=3438785 RepID=UPI003F8E4F41
MSEKERMIAGKLYNAEDKELRKRYEKARRYSYEFNRTMPEEIEKREKLLDELLGSYGEDVTITPPFRCDYGKQIHIGDHFFANYDCIMLDVAEIRIGDNVNFGPRVGLYTAAHPLDPMVRRRKLEYGKAITIEDDVWIGGDVVVNPGITIGEGSIIGSGSVVTRSIPKNVVAKGNPCRVIREITEEDKRYWKALEEEYDEEIEREQSE